MSLFSSRWPNLLVWKVTAHRAYQGIDRVLSLRPFFGTKQEWAVPLYGSEFLREKTKEVQEVLFVTQVVTLIIFNMFTMLCSFKEHFTHCNLPSASRESPLL